MKLTLYPADKGDCLLVTSADGRHMLVDGGMRGSYQDYVAPELERMRERAEQLDLVLISHIDQDHIAGILQLLDDLVGWRIHEYQLESGNEDHPAPKAGRPPEILSIWHNAFAEQVGENAGPIEDALIATATVLSGDAESDFQTEARNRRDLATSVSEAIRVTRRVGPEQLKIPLNRDFGDGLVHVRDGEAPPSVSLGSMRITVIAPFAEELGALRGEWNSWLETNRAALEKIERQALEDQEHLGAEEFVGVLLAQAEGLGDESKVTAPNLASIMLLVVEGGTSFILTGDGHAHHILEGLRRAGKLDEGGIHVSVLKVQHHGSEYNIDEAFCKAVTADHYVFCANGEYANPDLRVIDAIIDSRVGSAEQLSPNPQTPDPFTLWFNSSSALTEKPEDKAHMEAVERLVAARAAGSNGRLGFEFRQMHSEDNPGLEVVL